MPDDPLAPPAAPPAPAPRSEPTERGKKIFCEFCQCRLDSDGNVLQRGEAAKKFSTLEEENIRLKGKVTELEARLRPNNPEDSQTSGGLLV